ncbi:Transposase_28 domain-containing protein [Cephalotus follicularis]|uniref:Transposase_28 domain-containing protein n=1 Tax=Cephalotus follicularis TaxID=3775 RepID=A0A1Q3AQ14_CEPFO|nr:Transposase_28 domain-containing protein [Cephalotus follicularis]
MRPHKLAQLVKEYAIPGGLDLEIPADLRSVTVNQPGHFVVFQDALEHGLRLPLPPFAVTVLRHYQIHPSMLQAQSWGFIVGFLVRCLEAGAVPTMGLFKEFHTVAPTPKKRGFHFKSSVSRPKMLAENTKSIKRWREKYFLVKNLPGFTPCLWTDSLDTGRLNQRSFLTREEVADLRRLSALEPEDVLKVVSEDRLRRHGLSMSVGRRARLELEAEEVSIGVQRERERAGRS